MSAALYPLFCLQCKPVPWWQLTEVPRDAGPQFNIHFTVSADSVDGGRGKMMLHLRPNHLAQFLSRKWGLQHFLRVHGVGSLSRLPNCNSWLCMAGSCGSLADVAWGASGGSPRAVAAGLSLTAAAWGGGKLEVEAGSSHLPMRQQDLSDAAALWIPDCWQGEGGARTVFYPDTGV